MFSPWQSIIISPLNHSAVDPICFQQFQIGIQSNICTCLITKFFSFPTELCLEKGVWTKLDYKSKFDCSFDKIKDTGERIHANDVSVEEFIEKYEKPYKPVVIRGITDNWKAQYKWTLEVRIFLFVWNEWVY